jgi:hypothetical protein
MGGHRLIALHDLGITLRSTLANAVLGHFNKDATHKYFK